MKLGRVTLAFEGERRNSGELEGPRRNGAPLVRVWWPRRVEESKCPSASRSAADGSLSGGVGVYVSEAMSTWTIIIEELRVPNRAEVEFPFNLNAHTAASPSALRVFAQPSPSHHQPRSDLFCLSIEDGACHHGLVPPNARARFRNRGSVDNEAMQGSRCS